MPEDLSVAVGLLIEKYLTELAEGRKESNRSHSDRSVLINEVKTLTEEKVRQQHRHMHTPVYQGRPAKADRLSAACLSVILLAGVAEAQGAGAGAGPRHVGAQGGGAQGQTAPLTCCRQGWSTDS